jgi:hypothetical protein
MNPKITIHSVFNLDEMTLLRYTVEIPRVDGSSLIHGTAQLESDIEIPITE